MLPGGQELSVTKKQGHLRYGECDEAQAHQDGAYHADEEREVVSFADTLV